MTKDAAYYREYRKTPKHQAYIKAYRDTDEYRSKQRELSRRYRAKRKEHADISAAQDET